MTPKTTRILLVEDNPGDARLIREMLAEIRDRDFEIDWVTSLSQAMASLAGSGIDLVILDLNLPDSQGLDTFSRAYKHGSHLPFLVLTGHADENLGVTAVRQGAQDYLFKEEVTTGLFYRAIRYAIERKQAEQALRESEEKYRDLVNQITAVVFRGYADWSIETFDRKIESLTGYPKEDFDTRRRKWSDLILEEDLPQVKDNFLGGMKTTGTYAREYRIRKKSGEIIWVQGQGRIFQDAVGRIDYVSGVIFDITARKKAEEALLKYEFIANTAKDCMTLIDRNYVYEAANAAYCQAHGKTREEVVGQSVTNIWGQKTFDSTIKGYLDRCFAGQAVEYEGWFAFGKRGIGCYHVSYNPCFNEDGTVAYAAVLSHDITRHKQTEEALGASEENYRLLVKQIPAVVFRGYGDWSVDFFDEKVELLTGYPKADFDSRRLKWSDLILPEDLEEMKGLLLKSLRTSRSYVREYRIRKKNGEIAWLQGRGQVFLDPHGEIAHISGVFFDITDHKRAEAEIRLNEARLAGLLRISQYSPTSIQELLDYALEEAITLTGSKIGYIYFYDENTQQLTLNTWSKEVMQVCTVAEPQTIYQLEKMGIWGEAVRQARYIMVNDFQAPHPLKKGYPEGHAPLYRYLTIPVISGNRIVAMVGVANKATDYDDADVRQLTLMMDAVWKIVERQRAEEDLRKSEERYRLLVSQIPAMVFKGYADWSVDFFDDKVEELTGYSKADFDSRKVKWCDLIPAEDLDYATRVFIEALKTNKSFVREHRLRKKDGEIIWVQCRGQIFCNDQGKIDYISGVSFDVTERRRAQEGLKERERFLADIFDSIQDGISILDADFNILRVNQALDLWFPHALPLAGKKCFAAYRQRSVPCEVCPSRETLETGKAGHAVMTKIGPDGEAAGWLEVYTFPMLEISSGKMRGVIQYLRDITKRKQAEEALQLSEEKYRLLVKQIPAVVFKGYADWSVDFFDNKIEALTGYGKEEFDSRQIKWCELILPEDLEQAKGRFINGIKTGGAYEREYRLRKKDGGIAWIQAMGQIFYDAEGKLDYISGVFFDITERVLAEQKLRESNERFAAVFENAAIGISVTDAQGRIIAANPRFQEMLGYQAGELLAKTFPEITHPEDLPKNLELFQEMMTGKSEGYLLEKRYLRKNGEYFWALVTVSSIKETKEQPPYSIAVVRDITLRKQTQEKLEESAHNLRYLAAQLLTTQERERQRISRDLHDDLGQSLVAFKLQLEAIEREEPANLTVLRQKLAIQIAFIDDIVNNVRRLCMDLRPTTLDALGLTVALKRLFKEFSALYGFKFSLHLEDVRGLLSLKAQIIIYRIFQESLTNIVKYAQATRIAVTIKRENSTVFFTVEDNGKGFNLEQVRARKDGKRGLGLVAMEERVRMLGGTLEMQSQKGVGTKISFKIPVS